MKRNNIISLAFYFFAISFSNVLALPSCPSSGYFDNCSGSDFLPDGSKYIGEYKQDKPHGEGILTKPNGDKYVGEWKNGDREGQGTLFYSNGDKYVGQWRDDKFNGNGTFTWGTNTEFSGYKYVGQFKNNNREGQGVITYPDGDKYIGQLSDDKFNGQGTFIWADGGKYDGNWKNNDQSGYGTYTFSDGRKYIGEWDGGKYQGLGKLFHSDGSINKEGIFKNGEFLSAQSEALPACPASGYFHNCFGIYEFDDGGKYVGEWLNDKIHGQGAFTFPSGNKYLGEFKDGDFNGQGTFIWADGGKYVGEWLNDKKNGQGTHTYADGAKYVGEWQNNEYHGQGTFTYPDGKKVVGNFENDKLNGYATKYYADGNIYQRGIFKDDEFLNTQETSPNNINKNNQNNDVIQASSGSGFAVSSDGYVITNNHVIEGCQEVIVHTKEKDIKTRIISSDRPNDLALLKGDFRPEAVLALSNNRPVLLEDIYVAGYPFGNSISSSIKVTKGIISSLTGIGNNYSNIQFDAALQPGNSGGPIIDNNGNVVAVAVSKLNRKFTLENFDVIPENTNFGIVSGAVKNILDSNNVVRPVANQSELSKERLRKMMSSGTYYISCWMTQAQIELLKSKKVLFEKFK